MLIRFKRTFLRDIKGLTLVESLISIILLSVLLVSILGAFFISRLSTVHAKHRLMAMNILQQYMEQEVRAKYDGGSDGEGDYYATLTSASPVSVTIDDRSTADTSDDLLGTLLPDPYSPDNIENADGSPISQDGVPFKIIGFIVSWTEDMTGQTVNERQVAYVAYHPTS